MGGRRAKLRMSVPPPANILVVDDDQGLLRLMERTLKRQGFSTATASSGKDAIAWLGQNFADLMLLDVKLPDHKSSQARECQLARRF